MTTYFVMPGETLSGVTLSGGDTELVGSGGAATATIINGGFQDDLGAAIGTIINAGFQYVESGAMARNTVIYGDGQLVEAGGTASDTTVYGGGEQLVMSGGTVSGTIINGGLQDDFGIAVSTTTPAA